MQTFSSLSSSRRIPLVIPAQAGIQLIQSINLRHFSFRHPGVGRDPVDDICRQPVSFSIIKQVDTAYQLDTARNHLQNFAILRGPIPRYDDSAQFRTHLYRHDENLGAVRRRNHRVFINNKACFRVHNYSTQMRRRNRIHRINTNRRYINS